MLFCAGSTGARQQHAVDINMQYAPVMKHAGLLKMSTTHAGFHSFPHPSFSPQKREGNFYSFQFKHFLLLLLPIPLIVLCNCTETEETITLQN